MGKHFNLGPSAAHKWMTCTQAPHMEAGYESKSSEYAAEGSEVHDLVAECLEAKKDMKDVTDNLDWIEAGQQYLDLVRSYGGLRFVEVRLHFDHLIPGGFGTADCVVLRDDELIVVDYKHGKGVEVHVAGNPQFLIYASAALAEYGAFYEINRLKTVVVQPRIGNIDEADVSLKELAEFEDKVRKAYHEYLNDPQFRPSTEACRWCLHSGNCEAQDRWVAEQVSEHFLPGVNEEITPDPIEDVRRKSPEAMARAVEAIKGVKQWITAVEAAALDRLMAGEEVPGYKAVEGRATRKWVDEDAVLKALGNVRIKGKRLKQENIFTRKLCSPAQIEKVIGKQHKILKAHVTTGDGKPTLAPASDKRPAISIAAHFNQNDE